MPVKGKHKLQIHTQIDARTDFGQDIWNTSRNSGESAFISEEKTIKIEIK